MPALPWSKILILPIAYQSGNLTFSEWASLLTLCLTPLAAHILVGVPLPTYLDTSRPKWHDRLCHYNPTSILWRYGIIADRWFRAREWDRVDLAATNALFWTGQGWNGDEDMIDHARSHCVRLPDSKRASLFTGEALGTLIITLQGAQAVFVLANGLAGAVNDDFNKLMAVDKVFFPLAIFGLLRLWACPILTNEFTYLSHEVGQQRAPSNSGSGHYLPPDQISQYNLVSRSKRFRATSSWRSILFRTVYFACVLGMLALTSCYLSGGYYTTTTFILAIFYLALIGVTVLIFGWYLGFKHATATIIPCIASAWYKVYTAMVMCFGVALIAIACFETRKTPCGKFTSGPPSHDLDACLGVSSELVVVGHSLNDSSFGPAAHHWTRAGRGFIPINVTDEQPHVTDFNGMCFGDGLREDKAVQVLVSFLDLH